MPELPEVETTRRGISRRLKGQQLKRVIVRQPLLRWPVPDNLSQYLLQSRVHEIKRRAKYLLFRFDQGYLLIHLGMSGSLRIVSIDAKAGKHDHVDFVFSNDLLLRYTDPRRFGAVLWLGGEPDMHPLLNKLGPEPLDETLTGKYFHTLSRNRKVSVKQFLMDQSIVTGIGNIYANEVLFTAAIRPATAAGKISLRRYRRLTGAIKNTLQAAIAQGGTTLRDFVGGDGKPGYFQQQLNVYGRGGLACTICHAPLKEIKQAGRSTVYCPHCQR